MLLPVLDASMRGKVDEFGAGTVGGLAVHLGLSAAAGGCDEEVALGVGCCAVLCGLAEGLGLDDILLPMFWRASCVLM